MPPGLSENGSASALILNAELLIVAVVTVNKDDVTFLTAIVCVTLFPIGTEPKETVEGVEASEEARVPLGVIATLARHIRIAALDTLCRRNHPGRMLFKKASWNALQKRFWIMRTGFL